MRGKSVKDGLDVLTQWDRKLVKGLHSARFFELWLNVCDGPALAAAVASRIADLKTFESLALVGVSSISRGTGRPP